MITNHVEIMQKNTVHIALANPVAEEFQKDKNNEVIGENFQNNNSNEGERTLIPSHALGKSNCEKSQYPYEEEQVNEENHQNQDLVDKTMKMKILKNDVAHISRIISHEENDCEEGKEEINLPEKSESPKRFPHYNEKKEILEKPLYEGNAQKGKKYYKEKQEIHKKHVIDNSKKSEISMILKRFEEKTTDYFDVYMIKLYYLASNGIDKIDRIENLINAIEKHSKASDIFITLIPFMAFLAGESIEKIPSLLKLLKKGKNDEIILSKYLVACVMVHLFFGLIPNREKHSSTQEIINLK